jgi:hypothetical protein
VTTPESPNYERSRGILIGTSKYNYLPNMPAALNSLQDMRSLLVNSLCGWPKNRISIFENAHSTGGIKVQLAQQIRDASDVLFVYYVGHGQPTLSEDLCMGLVDTTQRAEDREFTGLMLGDIRKMLRNCPARVKVVILDCCFSGIATENRQSAEDETVYISGLTRMYGAYTLTASEANSPARYDNSRVPRTLFTKTLVDLVRTGIPGAPGRLTLDDIFPHLLQRSIEQRLPEPTRMSIHAGCDFAFAFNAAPPESHVDPIEERRKMQMVLSQLKTENSTLKRDVLRYSSKLTHLRRQMQFETNSSTYYLNDDRPVWFSEEDWRQ